VLLFYENLYKQRDEQDHVNIDDYVYINKLTKMQSDNLEGEITMSELSYGLKNMKNNKTPGPDGFTVEFYKTFWVDISGFLLRSLNEGYRNGNLTNVQLFCQRVKNLVNF
jgi:hypothetical protein